MCVSLTMPCCNGLSWLGVSVMVRAPSVVTPSQAQPLPKRPAAEALNFVFIASKDPYFESAQLGRVRHRHIAACILLAGIQGAQSTARGCANATISLEMPDMSPVCMLVGSQRSIQPSMRSKE